MPFGFLFAAFFLLAGLGFGVVSFVWGCRRHSRGAKWAGAGIVALVCALVAVEVAFENDLEWNPQILADAEICGAWAGPKATLTLATNRTFNYQSSARTVSGTWTRDDWNLYLRATNYTTTMRFMQYRGQFHLLTDPPTGDPDLWNGGLGLTQK